MTRAIVEGMVDDFHYRVRIPVLNKIAAAIGATPVEELSIATIAIPPGVSPKFRSGDIVFVEFEEGDTSKPVIVGSLFNTLDSQIVSDAKFDSLSVNVNTTLKRETQIGEVTADNIANIKGLNTNVQYEIDSNKAQHIEFVSQISDIQSDIGDINKEINDINNINDKQDIKIEKVENRVTNIETTLEGPLILNNLSYGTKDPKTISGAKEGQVYLWIQHEA
jgi:hypothetical protein